MTELENLLRDVLWHDKGKDFYKQADDAIQKVRQLEIIKNAVLLGCDPPDDCNDPVVLKNYMKGCFEQANREYPK